MSLVIKTVPAGAQQNPFGDIYSPLATPATQPPSAQPPTTPAPRQGVLQLQARLHTGGDYLKTGLRWRVNKAVPNKQGRFKQIAASDEAVTRLKVPVGKYIVTAVYGYAYLSQTIEVSTRSTESQPAVADFVLHAGALDVKAVQTGKGEIPPEKLSIKLYLDERDQDGNRLLVMDKVPTDEVLRLNAGIYYLVSHFGPHNATINTTLAVEPGKLTHAVLRHNAGQVLVKLVNRAGGEALTGTRWEIRLPDGQVVGKSVGAAPSFILQAGEYHVIATNQHKTYRRRFELPAGVTAELEIDTSEKGAADK